MNYYNETLYRNQRDAVPYCSHVWSILLTITHKGRAGQKPAPEAIRALCAALLRRQNEQGGGVEVLRPIDRKAA